MLSSILCFILLLRLAHHLFGFSLHWSISRVFHTLCYTLKVRPFQVIFPSEVFNCWLEHLSYVFSRLSCFLIVECRSYVILYVSGLPTLLTPGVVYYIDFYIIFAPPDSVLTAALHLMECIVPSVLHHDWHFVAVRSSFAFILPGTVEHCALSLSRLIIFFSKRFIIFIVEKRVIHLNIFIGVVHINNI